MGREGSVVALFRVRKGRDRREAPGFLSQAFPRVWGGLSIPLPRRCWGHLGLCWHQGMLLQRGCPGGAAPWRGDSHRAATTLQAGLCSGCPAGTRAPPPRRTLPCPHPMLEGNLVGARFCPHRSSSARRGSQGAEADFSHPAPGSSQAMPACSVWDAARVKAAGEAAPPCPPSVLPVVLGSCPAPSPMGAAR